jgi:glycosyltransferase involved in cell wall biosynthesis
MHILWQRLRLPLPVQAITGPLDLFHSPDFVLPPTGRTPTILTVHDLSFLRVPHCFVPAFRRYLQGAVSRAVQRAGRILADSRSTSHDLTELLAVKPQRVTVLYPGVESRFRPIRDEKVLHDVQRRYKLPHRFVLGLSTLQPRKNYPGLVEGFRRLLDADSGTSRLADLRLVIAGGEGWMTESVYGAVVDAGLKGRVHFAGYVDDTDLPALYNLSLVFAFPSLYEGFGLPALEAMACGVPVVAADNSSLPEVVGDAGLLVDASDANALAMALLRVLEDEKLRSRLASAGPRQAQRFSWGAAAEQLLRVYRALA